MNRIFLMGAGAALGAMALTGCDPYPTIPDLTISIDNPTDAQADVPLTFTSNVTINGDFTITDPGCDPSNVTFDINAGVLVPLWDPYSCAGVDADGNVPQNQGNIQFFVDGIFHAFSADPSKAVQVDLSPAIEFAFYDYAYDEYGEPIDVTGDGTLDDDVFYLCSFYNPDDNLGYASTMFNESEMAYTYEELYGFPLLDPYTGEAMDPQPPGNYEMFALYYLLGIQGPWQLFDYLGSNGSGYVDDDGDGAADNPFHIFYAELHGNNHSPIYGVNRTRVITGDVDYSSMPDNWCGWYGLGNILYFL